MLAPILSDRAFGCIVTAFGGQACGTTLTSLRVIAHALRAWPTPFGATLNTSTSLFTDGGQCIDAMTCDQLALVAAQVVDFAKSRDAGLKSAQVEVEQWEAERLLPPGGPHVL
jgi:FMN reductase